MSVSPSPSRWVTLWLPHSGHTGQETRLLCPRRCAWTVPGTRAWRAAHVHPGVPQQGPKECGSYWWGAPSTQKLAPWGQAWGSICRCPMRLILSQAEVGWPQSS